MEGPCSPWGATDEDHGMRDDEERPPSAAGSAPRSLLQRATRVSAGRRYATPEMSMRRNLVYLLLAFLVAAVAFMIVTLDRVAALSPSASF